MSKETGRAMDEHAASARSAIASFVVMDMMRSAAALEAQGRSIVHMEVGQPGTPAPRMARERVCEVLNLDALGYTLALGTDALRARIARSYKERHGLDIAPERVIVTTGSSAAFVLAFLSLFDVGECVALPSPGYPCYRHILSALGLTHTILETGPETRWMPTEEMISQAAQALPLHGLLLASPANPTGTMLSPERLREILGLCDRLGLWFISDEIYHGLVYEAREATALAFSDRAIVINSFSKYYSMTGWRVGWMVVPEALVRPVERLAQNLYIAPPAVSQIAALGAFDAEEELETNRATYATNRALLLAELPALGFSKLAPADGAFYLYADVSEWSPDSRQLSLQLLEEAGVATTPGVDFDERRGARFLRFSYAGATPDIEEAVRRLRAWQGARTKI